MLSVRDCAVATSSTTRRRWITPSGIAHHVIDPRTGAPSETDLASATVVSATVAAAEVTAKQLLLLGRSSARSFAEANGVAALLVGMDTGVTVTPAMEKTVVV
jgi:thiamine biosynthesis lipoprotein